MSRDTEADFLAAHRRLSLGAPYNDELRQRAALGTLEINLSTLAKEAGHSRTLIGTRDTKYPRVRALIFPDEQMVPGQESEREVDAVTRPPRQKEVIQALREEKKALALERDQFATRLAECAIALALSQKENAALKERLERLEMP
ncbi:hypothetical protein CO663_16935 [Rhizobium anhuiense]|uniref:hypothetical protein n=1 Tax=Rhizobium anhuiense TaxID=1184720 RepID=UPI000BEACF33|nr:hypothetical protein [Rhizobium anhuiense]PDS57765.1 hypothetical protein CO663_16935 [Rhizobium anhuiense]